MWYPLQQMAVRCYCLRFTQADHQFLHESHVFSNISRILVKSDDEDTEDNNTENAQVWTVFVFLLLVFRSRKLLFLC